MTSTNLSLVFLLEFFNMKLKVVKTSFSAYCQFNLPEETYPAVFKLKKWRDVFCEDNGN